MADEPDVSRRRFLLGRFRKPTEPRGEAVPGPGGLRGSRRELPADLLSLNTQVTLHDPPAIYDITLDEDAIDALFRAIETEATHLVVQTKGAPMQEARELQPDLRHARQALGRRQNVQLRYRHRGVLWSDTCRATSRGTLLTRVQLPEDPTA